MNQAVRIEHDLIGDRQVPAAAYYGVHTLRAILRPEVPTQPHFSTVHRPKGDA